jgi:hypothetical protein
LRPALAKLVRTYLKNKKAGGVPQAIKPHDVQSLGSIPSDERRKKEREGGSKERKGKKLVKYLANVNYSRALVAHICNPTYLGG